MTVKYLCLRCGVLINITSHVSIDQMLEKAAATEIIGFARGERCVERKSSREEPSAVTMLYYMLSQTT